jgi:hypothetical protein
MTVFVYYPRGTQTGGPEALHQLVHELGQLGVDAALVPLAGTEGRGEVDAYRRYSCRYADRVVDEPGSVIVSPEISLSVLRGVDHATRVIWWLSIDNAPLFRVSRMVARTDPSRLVLKARLEESAATLLGRRSPRRTQRQLIASSVNCTQSAYAWSFLYSRLHVVPSMLSDYTSIEEGTRAPASAGDRPVVAYNPRRGAHHYPELIRRRPDLEWLPIQAMSRREVVAALRRSTIFLDLGHQPGKDRLPREAALAGAVVVIAREGAGAYDADFPLPWRYKVGLGGGVEQIVESALGVIDTAIADPAKALEDQQGLVSWVADERRRFRAEVEAIFVRHELGSDVPGFR